MPAAIQFLLNNEIVTLSQCMPDLTVLQYLREIRYQSGTKEGCASGDCGACTVVVAQLSEDQQSLQYQSINSCICFVASLQGKQLLTIEHLQDADNSLHPVQQAFVDNHASQCGFCTPGFVMSSFALYKQKSQQQKTELNIQAISNVTKYEVEEALAGNLCRCTGYKSIINAAIAMLEPKSESHESEQKNGHEQVNKNQDHFSKNEAHTIELLQKLNSVNANNEVAEDNTKVIPSFFAPKSAEELANFLLKNPESTLVAGGTDLALMVTQQLSTFNSLVYLGNVAELNLLSQSKEQIIIGAAVPYSKFTYLLEKPFPELAKMISRIGSTQIRNVGTLGGNIGNASPIGDMPPALIVLSASLTLQKGSHKRKLAVEDFFKDYKVTDLQQGEFIKNIIIPKLNAQQHLKIYKITKRFDDDISAVLAAICVELTPNKPSSQKSNKQSNKLMVSSIKIAFGGMAAIPKRAVQTEQALQGKAWQQSTIDAAKKALTQDFQPMSDVRASSQYRLIVAQNLLQKCFVELTNELSDDKSTIISTQVVDHA